MKDGINCLNICIVNKYLIIKYSIDSSDFVYKSPVYYCDKVFIANYVSNFCNSIC